MQGSVLCQVFDQRPAQGPPNKDNGVKGTLSLTVPWMPLFKRSHGRACVIAHPSAFGKPDLREGGRGQRQG